MIPNPSPNGPYTWVVVRVVGATGADAPVNFRFLGVLLPFVMFHIDILFFHLTFELTFRDALINLSLLRGPCLYNLDKKAYNVDLGCHCMIAHSG